QIYAYPFVPPVAARELEQQRAYFAQHQRGLLEDMVAREISDARRLVYHGPHVAAFTPICARYSYEVWIAPVRPAPSFAALTRDENAAAQVRRPLVAAVSVHPRHPPGADRRRRAPRSASPCGALPRLSHARPLEVPRRQRNRRGRLHGGHAARRYGHRAPGRA